MALNIRHMNVIGNIKSSCNLLNAPEKNIQNDNKDLLTEEFQMQYDPLLEEEPVRLGVFAKHLLSTIDYVENKSMVDMSEPTSLVGEVVTDGSRIYKILEYKASGGMAHVYLAQELEGKNTYAIKMMRPELSDDKHRNLFQLEVELIGKIKHPNIVSMYGSSYYQDMPFFVMEYADGGTLESAIQTLPSDRFLLNMSQVCKALNCIHQVDIIHKDVKPSNILLFKNGVAKLADFGIAYLSSEKRLTSKDSGVGTFSYMAPEQAKNILYPENNFEPTPSVDLYAIGAMLYQKFTNKLPIEEPSNNRIVFLKQIAEEKPKPPLELNPTMHPILASLISTLLVKDPKQRFHKSANQLANILQYLVKNQLLLS